MAVIDLLPRRKKEAPEPPSKPVHKGRLIIPVNFGRNQVLEWSTDDPESIDAARLRFNSTRAAGYAGFESFEVSDGYGGTTLSQGTSTPYFHPEAKEIRMTAAAAGG